MNRAVNGRSVGYTIIETMIFLGVSAALFITAMAFINGRQSRTEFTSAIRDFEGSINDIANDVSDGYYTNNVTYRGTPGMRLGCTAGPTSVTLSATTNDNQGSNKGCIFIGKALQFVLAGNDGKQKYTAITLVGRQYKGGDAINGDVQTYSDSLVAPFAPTLDNTDLDATVTSRIGGGVTAECVFYANTTISPAADRPCVNTAGITRIDTVAFMTQFHSNTFDGKQETGSAVVNIVVPNAAHTGPRDIQTVASDIEDFTDSNITINPKGGVYICLQSNGSNQYALTSLGGSSGRFTSNTRVITGKCL